MTKKIEQKMADFFSKKSIANQVEKALLQGLKPLTVTEDQGIDLIGSRSGRFRTGLLN